MSRTGGATYSALSASLTNFPSSGYGFFESVSSSLASLFYTHHIVSVFAALDIESSPTSTMITFREFMKAIEFMSTSEDKMIINVPAPQHSEQAISV